jgi:hypothetical protein
MNEQTQQDRNRRIPTMRLAAGVLAAAALAAGAGTALAATADGRPVSKDPVVNRDADADAAKDFDQARNDYDRLFAKAKELDVEPKHNASDDVNRDFVLDRKIEKLRDDVREETEPEYGTPESVGVSQSTLDSIAACESGGNPAAVDPSGTYRGKYQFDLGTWASVGGSGDPAAAPEAEQDYRAALLLSQSGSSPWPVCG